MEDLINRVIRLRQEIEEGSKVDVIEISVELIKIEGEIRAINFTDSSSQLKEKIMSTKVKHSESKNAWNVIGTIPGGKYKIARIPYFTSEGKDYEIINTRNKADALRQAEFISFCLNNENEILSKIY